MHSIWRSISLNFQKYPSLLPKNFVKNTHKHEYFCLLRQIYKIKMIQKRFLFMINEAHFNNSKFNSCKDCWIRRRLLFNLHVSAAVAPCSVQFSRKKRPDVRFLVKVESFIKIININ